MPAFPRAFGKFLDKKVESTIDNPQNSALVSGKFFQISSLLFCWSADLTVSLTCIKCGGFMFQSFELFRRRKVKIMLDGFCILNTLIDYTGNFYYPLSRFCFHLKFIPDVNGFSRFHRMAEMFHLPLVAGGCRKCSRFKQPDRPQIFVNSHFNVHASSAKNLWK